MGVRKAAAVCLKREIIKNMDYVILNCGILIEQ